MIRIAAILLTGALALGTASAVAQERLPIKAFFGTFEGGGVAESRDSVYFQTTARDFDVTVGPAGEGFRIAWTSLIRGGGTPENPEVRRNSTSRTLLPAGQPGFFRGSESGDPLAGDQELCWARINGNTLSLFLMTIDRDGIYELQQYDRTLSGAGMKLVFKSFRDGEELRTVTGNLVKTAR